MHLSTADEYFTRHASLPYSIVATSDPSWRERYRESFQNTQGQHRPHTGNGKYPNKGVFEALACLSSNGIERNVRLSRTLLPGDTILWVPDCFRVRASTRSAPASRRAFGLRIARRR